MRIRITRKLTGSIDGIQLDQFSPGSVYDVGMSLACYLAAIGAGEPITDEPAAAQQAAKDPFANLRPEATIVLGQGALPFPRAEAADRRRRTPPETPDKKD